MSAGGVVPENRRDFLKRSSLIAGSAIATSVIAPVAAPAAVPRPVRRGKPRMTLRFRPYTLELRHVFTIATSSRSVDGPRSSIGTDVSSVWAAATFGCANKNRTTARVTSGRS